MNDDAVLYSKTCEIQKFDANLLFDNYLHLMKWQDNDNILDVGAADGTVTFDVLIPRIPVKFNNVVLVDVAEKMVNFAKQRSIDKRIDVVQMDITLSVPKKFKEYFNHIFSFYCINCVGGETRQIQAMQNIFDMLKPGGDALLTIIVTTPYFGVWENMAKLDKWAPYMKDIQTFIGPYSYANNPPELLRKYLEVTGLAVNVCKYEKRSYIFSSLEEFMGFSISVTPFVKIIPEGERADFYADMEKELRKSDLMVFGRCDDGTEKIIQNYTVLIACASKLC